MTATRQADESREGVVRLEANGGLRTRRRELVSTEERVSARGRDVARDLLLQLDVWESTREEPESRSRRSDGESSEGDGSSP